MRKIDHVSAGVELAQVKVDRNELMQGCGLKRSLRIM